MLGLSPVSKEILSYVRVLVPVVQRLDSVI